MYVIELYRLTYTDFVSSNPSRVHRHAAEVILCNVKIQIDT